MQVTIACGICFKEGLKVYPVKVGATWRVEVKEDGKKPSLEACSFCSNPIEEPTESEHDDENSWD